MKVRHMSAALAVVASLGLLGCDNNEPPSQKQAEQTGEAAGQAAGAAAQQGANTATETSQDLVKQANDLIAKIKDGLGTGVPTKDAVAKVQPYATQLEGIKDKLPADLKKVAEGVLDMFNKAKQAVQNMPAIPGVGAPG